jgi:trehalose 6-phosphate phosphatase
VFQILARRHAAILEHFATSRVLLAFDYDGTLAPICTEPSRARLRPSTRRLLATLTQCYPCIVISGRSQSDVATFLGRLKFRQLIGNHGLELSRDTRELARRVNEWRHQLDQTLTPRRGLTIEHKDYSLAIHYRKVARKRQTIAEIENAIRRLQGVRSLGGIEAFNLVPTGFPHKGDALRRAVRHFGCHRAIFVGDEPTDEDVFRLGDDQQLLAIRVGASRSTAARYYLKSQGEVDQLLRRLLALRTA